MRNDAVRRGRCAGLVLVAVLLCSGCAQQAVPALAPATWAGSVDGLRRQADRQLDAGELALAEKILRHALAMPLPTSDGLLADARRLLRSDLYFALGRVQLLASRPADALRSAEQGLVLGGPASTFRANLFALRAMSLDALGRTDDALDAYAQAIQIHKTLFDEALSERSEGVQ